MPKRKTPPDLGQVIAQNIRVYRAAQRLSQEALAERCAIKRTYVGAIERGEVDIRVGTLAKIASGLGIDPYRLLIPTQQQLAVSKP
jgi:transcriptional regulator with XRE-family HTH domain